MSTDDSQRSLSNAERSGVCPSAARQLFAKYATAQSFIFEIFWNLLQIHKILTLDYFFF